METKPTSEIHLPPGFRFHPSDEELIINYLKNKIASNPLPATIIADLDLYKYNPWDLPKKASFGDDEWYFFTPRDRKYPNGARPNRAAASGYWKATGTDKPILSSCGTSIGVKKVLVFYKGRPPKAIKTDWIMHEYRLLETMAFRNPKRKGSMRLDDWVLCRVRQKSSFPRSTWEDRNINPSYEGYLPKVNNNPNIEMMKTYLYNDFPMLPYIFASQNSAISLQSSEKSNTNNDKNLQFTVTSFDNLLNPLKIKQNSCILPSKKITEADSDEKDEDVVLSISNNGIDMMNFYGITNHSHSNFNPVQWNSYMQCQELDDHLAFKE